MAWREEIIKKIIRLALEEDLSPNGDLSIRFIEKPEEIKKAQIIAKEDGVMACSWIAQAVLEEYVACHCEPRRGEAIHASVNVKKKDGQNFKAGDLLLEIEAPVHYLLSCERTILNFLQRLCAIAKAAREFTDLIKDYPCKLLDTRKTMPGMRLLEKEAFRAGGGTNHRLNLSDSVMLKENHLSVILKAKPEGTQAHTRHPSPLAQDDVKTIVEINKDNLNQLEKWLELGVDQIMLDNFSAEEAKSIINSLSPITYHLSPKIEISGNITKENIVDYAKTGCDYISTSACMTKVFNLDLSLIIY